MSLMFCAQSTESSVHVSIEDTYERTLMVDEEETILVVMDTWETEKQVCKHHTSMSQHIRLSNLHIECK